jgi:sigma-B regulation protein RsbU (phosphoserine phosphatase)
MSVSSASLPTYHDQLRSLLLLNQAAQWVNSILDLRSLLDTIVNDVAREFGCSHTVLLLKDPATEELFVAAAQGAHKPKGTRFRIGQQGMVGHAASIGQAYYEPDVRNNPHYIACDHLTLSELDIPMFAGDELIGVFSVEREQIDAFSPAERQVLQDLVNHIAFAIRNARLFENERAAKERMSRAQEDAREIQQALFPKNSPLIRGFRIEGRCLPAGEIGGDWYDYFQLDQNRYGFVLADVSGKGAAAGLLMTATRGMLRSLAQIVSSPAGALTRLNEFLTADFPPGRYVTMIYGVLDSSQGNITIANAGHPWPLLANAIDARFLENESGLPLGIGPSRYDDLTINLAGCSTMLLYSDGITEAENAAGQEYGRERLVDRAVTSNLTSESVLADVAEFAGTNLLSDDATVVVIKNCQN